MSTALLDVNVLVALAWPNHAHHAAARRWFATHSAQGWATTPITELGFVRISSNKKIMPYAATPGTAIDVLAGLCALAGHEFWPDDARLLEPPLEFDALGSHLQVTDVHLTLLAAKNKGRLVTFDRGIAKAFPAQERDVIEVLSAT
ncbi:TA system VapC family ribonuclease toxin [Amycolatopsis pigmentata]|uniref:Ribonuclease VapC n=1 Tax=Amycolatopsis pigmentata TaxID=450801 RepID=A0ABW5FSN9_9PSEU